MKTGRLPYKSLNDTLKALKVQVIDSLDYAGNNIPAFNNPEELFYYLKDRTKFKHDPKNVEYLQTLQTLFEEHNGKGDCDCFVIAVLACCLVQGAGWKNLIVTLAGRDKIAPVHIWSGINWQGNYYAMDLTQTDFDSERKYPYTQNLKFKI